jgi:RNA polymerase sigma-70 factor (ECF subfamily)
MNDSSQPHELRLEDLQWLRALAARLVRDPHLADDAVQDTLVRALERSPDDPPALRAWLASVLRNVLRQEWRGRSRRAAREAVREAPRREPSTLEVVEELALHRRLMEEVDALEEPYRSAILLRYLRGTSTAEIARDLGAPVKTVRTRLERGLAKLRERLGRDRAAWAVFLVRAPRGAPTSPLPLSLLLPMNVKAVSAVLGLVLIGAYFALRGAPASPLPELTASSDPRAPASTAPLQSSPEVQREVVRGEPAVTQASPARPASSTGVRTVRGFVRTLDGRGLPEIEVVFEHQAGAAPALLGGGFERGDGPRTRSEALGAFELELAAGKGRINVVDERYVGIALPHLDGAEPLTEPIVVVAPGYGCAGRVVDATGSPIAGAQVEVTLDGSFVQSRNVGGAAVHLLLPFAHGVSDERGEFRLGSVGFVEGAHVSAQADGFEPGRLELAEGPNEDLELVLLAGKTERTIHGLVLEASGSPASTALVSAGGVSVPCAADGSFVLDCEDWREDGWLRAVARGALPAELPLADALVEPTSREHPLVLRLGRAPLAIRGRVLDEDGAPVPSAVVFSPDTTPFGAIVFHESGHEFTGETTLEAFLNGVTGPWDTPAHCSATADGAFTLEGLLERTYSVFAFDPRTLDGVGPVELRAGDEHAELRLARGSPLPVAGRVVSRAGVPLPGVRVTLGRRFDWRAEGSEVETRWVGFPLRGPFASWTLPEHAATTDGEGRFELPPLVTRGAFLELRGKALVLGESYDLSRAPDPSDLEIVADAGSRFQIELRDPDEADAFSLVHLDGARVAVLFLEVEGVTISASLPSIDAGRSGVVLAEEGEYEIVLYSGDAEVRRERLSLVGGGLSSFRF